MRRFVVGAMAWVVAGAALAQGIEAKIETRYRDDSLRIRFPEAMQVMDNGDVAQLVRISPAAPVESCTWVDDTELACEFPKRLPLATQFRIELDAGMLRTVRGETLSAAPLLAETDRPALSASIREWAEGRPRIVVTTEHDVTQAAVQAALRLTLDGARVDVALQPGKREHEDLTFEITLPAVSRESTLELAVIPGLRSTDGPLPGTQDAVLLRAVVGEPFQVRGLACAGVTAPLTTQVREGRLDIDGCVPGEIMRLHFSRTPMKDVLDAWLAKWPAGAKISNTGDEGSWRHTRWKTDEPSKRAPGSWVDFEIPAPHAEVTLSIPALRAKDNGEAMTPVVARIATGKPRPAFAAPHERALLLPGTPPPVHIVNARADDIRVVGIAEDAWVETVRTPPAGDTPVPIRSTVAERALRNGGLTTWRPKDYPPAFHAAAPQFDLFAVAGDRDVVAWTHEWDNGAPVADAKVELLLQHKGRTERLATGRTDGDGKAALTLPADFVRPDIDGNAKASEAPQWILRAEHRVRGKTRRAVLPFAQQLRLGSSTGSGFGVADRPLYRAGDTVQWRLWLLQRRGKAMVPARKLGAVRLGLVERYSDTPLVEWTATPDENGAVAGSTVIPVHAPDEDYCVRVMDLDDDAGVCFYVGSYRVQDLWMRASSPTRLVRDGDTVQLDIEAGYYSGGQAAHAAFNRIEATLSPDTIAGAYPQWRGYRFAEADDSEPHPLDGEDALKATADAAGRAQLKFPAKFEDPNTLPPFGSLYITAESQLSDRDSTVSNPVRVPYARHARYVGLKLAPQWLDSTSPVRMQGVVVDAEGREVPDVPIEVEVTYSKERNGAAIPVHRCTLVAGQMRDCSFDRADSGHYTLTARSGDAASAKISQYVWSSDRTLDKASRPRLQLAGEAGVAGAPLRLLLEQPAVEGPALLVVSSDGAILDARVLRVAPGASTIDVPTAADWPRSVRIRLYLRANAPDAAAAPGFRAPVDIDELSVPVTFERAARVDAPVTMAFEPARTTPAGIVRLALRNTTGMRRNVTLAVVDDALRAIGQEFLAEMDPSESGVFAGASWDAMSGYGFNGWNERPWRWLLVQADPRMPDICAAPAGAGTDCPPVVVIGSGAINPIDVASVESTALGRLPVANQRDRSVELRSPGTDGELYKVQVVGAGAIGPAPAPPPPPPGDADLPVVFDEPSPVDAQGKPTDARQHMPPRPDTTQDLALARIRTHFADTALWRTDIVLAPGEERTIEFTAPDNLTRWRAIAWNDDGAGDFAMTDASLEAGLPVEARVQSPVRIYPGDRARLAANVRHTATTPVEAQVSLGVSGDTTLDAHPTTLPLAAQGQSSFGVELRPERPGQLLVTAAAATPDGRDAVAAPLEVASTTIAAQRTQAGWLLTDPVSLALPTLPDGATDPRLAVSVWRGNDALLHGWTQDLREYPHRCWEQILSRAVAAALALERKDPSWPDAHAVVREALDNAAVFQDYDGHMRFFAEDYAFDYHEAPRAKVPLTAWTVDAFALLRSLGHAVPVEVERRASNFLAEGEVFDKKEANELAIASAVVDRPKEVTTLWPEFTKLALPGRVAAARALARHDDPHAGEAIQLLLANAPLRAGKRVLARGGDGERWMSSPLREQCEMIRLLQDFPSHAPAGARVELIRGLSDLYSGGVPEVDTQSGAICLRALHGERAGASAPVAVDVRLGEKSQTLALQGNAPNAVATFGPATTGTLRIAAAEAPAEPVAYLARLDFNEDARQAQSSAIGLSIARRHEVLRKHRWTPLGDAPLQEGDWVRVTLTVTNARTRHFVAVTDDLPGGLRPVDLQLAGVAGVDMRALGDLGDHAFDQRKLDARKPKFYAELLPAGRHEIHYFARVANTGDYLAAPALAELMYGEATRARTASDRIRIADPAPATPGGAAPEVVAP